MEVRHVKPVTKLQLQSYMTNLTSPMQRAHTLIELKKFELWQFPDFWEQMYKFSIQIKETIPNFTFLFPNPQFFFVYSERTSL